MTELCRLRFRQVHLDFHTSECIPGIGSVFDKKAWQETLQRARVNSITCFSKCHHGWSYHPTQVGQMHPQLDSDLTRAQFEACKEIDVNVPLYISAGVDNVAGHAHPEWRELGEHGGFIGWTWSVFKPGFESMCFNTPYLDYLCAQIRETVRLFPECDGIFLDIIHQGPCCCRWCMQSMAKLGLDATSTADREKHAAIVLEKYYRETTAAATEQVPAMPVFHNSGHINVGCREILPYFSHLELESLPTGGWGYDHFPSSAKYALKLDHDFLGMTGKFHTSWGEFGGYKHPNALRYECAAMLAFGAKCSVGDQLHPQGSLDQSTYDVIGAAYREVEAKEAWCDNVVSVADIGLLTNAELNQLQAESSGRDKNADTGASRLLLENHLLFDVLDSQMDFSPYKMLILPDSIPLSPELEAKLNEYLSRGGSLFLSGTSGLRADGRGFVFDVGAQHYGASEFEPDYLKPVPELAPDFCGMPMVMYRRSQRLKVTDGESLGDIYDPYFNRDYRHFCSHRHTPNRPEASGFACGVRKGRITYLAHPVFSIYRLYGAVALKNFLGNCLRQLLGNEISLQTNLPSSARVSLMHQPAEKRLILHLLYAERLNRGGGKDGHHLEVIEELRPLHDIEVKLKLPAGISHAKLQPQNTELPLTILNDGRLQLRLDSFTCHQMIELS